MATEKATKVLPPRPSELGIGAPATEAETEVLADQVIDGDAQMAALAAEHTAAIELLTGERDEALLQLDTERKQAASVLSAITADRDALVKRNTEVEEAFGKQTEAFQAQWDAREREHATALQLAQSSIVSATGAVAATLVALPRAGGPIGAPRKLAEAPAGKTYALHRIDAGIRSYAPGDEVPRELVWDGVLTPGIHFECRSE